MTANEAMRWRYASKRMVNKTVPESTLNKIIESIHLSPSGLGMQPYEVFIISNKQIKSKILPIAFNQKQIVQSSHLQPGIGIPTKELTKRLTIYRNNETCLLLIQKGKKDLPKNIFLK